VAGVVPRGGKIRSQMIEKHWVKLNQILLKREVSIDN